MALFAVWILTEIIEKEKILTTVESEEIQLLISIWIALFGK